MNRKTYAQYFELALRINENEFIRTTEDAPKELREFIAKIHQSFDSLPNDWIYEQISDAFEHLQYDDLESIGLDADIYLSDIYTWFGQPYAHALCVEVVEVMGLSPKDVYEWISCAQWYARDRIYRMVSEFIQEEGNENG